MTTHTREEVEAVLREVLSDTSTRFRFIGETDWLPILISLAVARYGEESRGDGFSDGWDEGHHSGSALSD